MRHTLIILAIALAAPALHAQSLSTEITVDRTVVPEFVMAAKPYVAPKLMPFSDISGRLSAAEYDKAGNITRIAGTLSPAPWLDSISPTPYKGYAAVGLFPKNYGGTLGYRFISNADAHVGAWAQFMSQRYDNDLDNKASMGTDNITAAVDASLRTGRFGWLSAQLGYDYHKALYQRSYSLNRIFADADWRGQSSAVAYGLHANISTNSFKAKESDDKISQPDIKITGSISLIKGSDYPWLGIDVDARWLNSDEKYGGSFSHYAASPYLRYSRDGFTAKLGVMVSAASKYDLESDYMQSKKTKTTLTPNVRIDYAPERTPFAVYLNITGSQKLNPLFEYMLIDPYMFHSYAFDSSRVPLQFDGGLSIGSFAGFSLGINGSFAQFRDWLMPVDGTSVSFLSQKFNGWKVGVEAKYAYRSYGEVSVGYQRAGSNEDGFTWGEWHDSAKQQLLASLTATPISALKVNVSYKLRTGRKSLAMQPLDSRMSEVRILSYEPQSLGKIADLSAEASYTVSEAWPVPVTFYVRAHNILNRKYNLISGLPASQFHALIGAAVQF